MTVDPNIQQKADDIREKVYGNQVRESLASGLEAMSSDVVENEGRQSVVESRQDSVESQWQQVIEETTDKDVISAPEIIAARNNEDNLKDRLDKEHQQVTAQLAQTDTVASSNILPFQFETKGALIDNGDYSAWPHANSFYDKDLDKFVLFYNQSSGHLASDGKIKMVRKNKTTNQSEEFTVVDDAEYGYRTHGATQLASGEYIVTAMEWLKGTDRNERTGCFLFRSDDKGMNWTRQKIYANNEPILNYHIGSIYQLESGRILILGNNEIYYSDNNGVGWGKIDLQADTSLFLEGSFLEIDDTVICFARDNRGSHLGTEKFGALFMKSTDGGNSWSRLTHSSYITDMTANCGSLKIDKQTGNVYYLHASRFKQDNGLGSIYLATASKEKAKNGEFNVVKVMDGKGTADFGYPELVQSDDGIFNAFFYSGDSSSTKIYWLTVSESKASVGDFFYNSLGTGFVKEMDLTELDWFQGTLDPSGAPLESSSRIRSDYYKLGYPLQRTVVTPNLDYKMSMTFYDWKEKLISGSNTGWLSKGQIVKPPENARIVRFVLAKNDDSNITPSDVKKSDLDLYVDYKNLIHHTLKQEKVEIVDLTDYLTSEVSLVRRMRCTKIGNKITISGNVDVSYTSDNFTILEDLPYVLNNSFAIDTVGFVGVVNQVCRLSLVDGNLNVNTTDSTGTNRMLVFNMTFDVS